MIKKSLKRLERLLFFVILSVGTAILLKWGVVAGYTIPTSSMEPTLIGDPVEGDKVAVFKLQYKFFDPDRYDLVVFFKEGLFPEKPGLFERQGGLSFIKRVVAFPGETVLIQNGDLYFGLPPAEPDRKTLAMLESLLIPVYRTSFEEGFFSHWAADTPGALDFCHLTEKSLVCDGLGKTGEVRLQFTPPGGIILDDYLVDGERWGAGRNPVRDLALTLEVEFLSDAGQLLGKLIEGGNSFNFTLRAAASGGGGQILWNFGTEKKVISSKDFPGFEKGVPLRITFLNIDDRILLQVDGERLVEFNYRETPALQQDILVNTPIIGVRDGKVRFSEIRIDRDIHYTRDQGDLAVQKPYKVPDGHYFFLGDNSAESEDSRSFGSIYEDHLVGKPFMIFYPFDRMRFF